MAPNRLTTERILAEFERVIQSNKEFQLNDTVEINVIHESMPTGGKRSKRSEMNLEKHLDKKKSIVRIRNDDELCMARALVVAKAKLDNDPRDRQIRKSDRPLQTRMARELHQNANVPLGPCGIEQAKQFQAYLSEYQISIVSKEYGDNIMYAGPEKDKRIYLYMHNNHYDVITKMPGFFARNYYCHTCKKAYEHLEEHRCLNACKCCRFPTECPEVSWLTCPDCRRLFKSQQCFEQHKQTRGNARSVCERLIRCTNGQATVRHHKKQPEKHRCGLTKCWICGKYVQLEGHRCYIQPDLTLDPTLDLMLSVLSIGMSPPLSNFVGVIDMDGFMINGRFYCKEPRALRVGDAAASSFLFDIGVRWDDLTPKDRRTCRYVTQFIHKLPFGVPRRVEAFEISALGRITVEFYQRAWQNGSLSSGMKAGITRKICSRALVCHP